VYGKPVNSTRIPGRPPDFIYSNSTDHDLTPENGEPYGEAEYLSENPNNGTTTGDDSTRTPTLEEPVFVVLNNEDGNQKLDSKGKAILIKGVDHANLKGMSFLKREDDGTR